MKRISEKRNISPEQAIEILAQYGTKVTKEEAKMILDFMYKFTILAVNQIVAKGKSKRNDDKNQQSTNRISRSKDA